MNISQILPWLVIAIVAFVVLRMVVGAIKTSAKMMLWMVVLLAAGFGWLWWQANHGAANNLPGPTFQVEDMSQSPRKFR